MNRCILVFGMPRAGTTWIGKLFDSHPDTRYRHEPDSVCRLSLPLYPKIQVALRYREELEQFVASLSQRRCSKVVRKQPLFPKSYQSAAALCADRVGVAFAKTADRVRLKLPCTHGSTAGASGHAHLVWKSVQLPRRLSVCIDALPVAIP